MLSEKLITMMSGVITLRNMLSLKPNPAQGPRANAIARSGGAAATIISERRLKKRAAISAAERKADGIVQDAVALECAADFELHNRDARELRG